MRPKRRSNLNSTSTSSSSSLKMNNHRKSKNDSRNQRDIVVKIEPTYVYIELKLLNIDPKCYNFKQLLHKFLCVSSNCCALQVRKFIFEKMELPKEFEVVLVLEEFEVENTCPIIFIKNNYFNEEEKIILNYAIVEKQQMASGDDLNQN